MGTNEIITVSLLLTGLIFLFNERKQIVRFFTKKTKERDTPKEIKEIEKIMEEENVSFERAKDIFSDREVMKVINISKTEWDVGNGMILKQGDKISFVDKEVGFIQGSFFGLIEPKAVGYGNLYILKTPDNTFRQAPIAFVKKDTINVYQ